MCNEEIIKHMKEDMTFRGLSERTMRSYIWRVSPDIWNFTKEKIYKKYQHMIGEIF